MVDPSYPRRQQVQRLAVALERALGAAIAAVVGLLLAAAGQLMVAIPVLATAVALAVASQHARRSAQRNRVGAESEARVRRALDLLARDGWRVRHALDWPGRGDLDHVLLSPTGMGFLIETKTRRYTSAHVARTVRAARWLARRRRRYPRGVTPVVCVTRPRWVERAEGGALVVSLDRLVPTLQAVATSPPVTPRRGRV